MSKGEQNLFFGLRLVFATVFGFVCLSILLMRLWFLQGVYGSYYRDLSENNRLRVVRTQPARGTIFDRDGRVLVTNRPAFNIALIQEDIHDLNVTLKKLSDITGRSVDELRSSLRSQRGRYHFEPKVVIFDASRTEVAAIKANTYQLPGVMIDVVPTRSYPYNSLASQVFGYARQISRKQLDGDVDGTYRMGDRVGQDGLEKVWEEQLRGQSGSRNIEVDAMGRRKGELGIVDDIPGRALQLTLDLDLQLVAEEAFKDKRGALVALDPNTGEILALVSAPSYDLNMFATGVQTQQWQQITTDKAHPLTNKAIASSYPIGSTFKLVTSLAGLAEKKLSLTSEFNCSGHFMFAGRPYHCHKKTGHGMVSIKQALTVSCNVFYFHLGQLLGIDLIEKYARMVGLGIATGVDLPGEINGIVPSDAWKRARYGQRWYPGDTLPVSIGQGYLVATPIQMAVMISVIANSGTVFQPYLVNKVIDQVTGEVTQIASKVVQRSTVNTEVFNEVRSLAASVVNDPRGTGKAAKLDTIVVGGKTGTAQVIGLGKKGDNDHAWFVTFAPVEKPMLAIAIIVENGGHGGTTAAPIAKQVYEKFFRKKGMLPPEENHDVQNSSQDSSQNSSQHGSGTVNEPVQNVEEEIDPETSNFTDDEPSNAQ